jgi:hypothetical protein
MKSCIRRCLGMAICLAILYVQCTIVSTAGGPGTGSETTNGVFAKVTYAGGQPAIHADVYLRSKDFLPDTVLSSSQRAPDQYTDSTGKFDIDSVSPGSYYIEVNDGMNNADLIEFVKASQDTGAINLGAHTLKPASTLSGHVERENLAENTSIYVQIYGLNQVVKVDNDGAFSFRSLPQGNYALRIASSDSKYGVVDRDTVVVGPAFQFNAGNFLLPIDFWQDTVIIRKVLDVNAKTEIPVSTVAFSRNKGRILQLDLSKLGLSKLPAEIGLLRVTHLYLNDNQFESLPDEIGQIASLVALRVDKNHLKRLPQSLSNLRRLVQLNASENNIDSLPEWAGRSVLLENLWLRENNLQSLPESIGWLSGLRVLDLEENQLTSLPASITNLRELTYLSVLHNRLNTYSPEIGKWLDIFSTESEWRITQVR